MIKMNKKIFKAVLIILLIGFGIVYANAAQIKLENPLSCDDVSCLISKIIDGLTMLVIPLLVLMTFVGGFQILFARGNEENFSKGKKTLWYAVLGFIITLLANGIDSIIKSILEAK
jgi:hypothetical protein